MTEFEKQLNADFQTLVEVTRVIQDLWAETTQFQMDHWTLYKLSQTPEPGNYLSLIVRSNPTLKTLVGEWGARASRLPTVIYENPQPCGRIEPCCFHHPTGYLLIEVPKRTSYGRIVSLAKQCSRCGDAMERDFTETGPGGLGIWHPWNCICGYEEELCGLLQSL